VIDRYDMFGVGNVVGNASAAPTNKSGPPLRR
jgi:hypothetical protein